MAHPHVPPPHKPEPEPGFGSILLYVLEFLVVLGVLAFAVTWLSRIFF